MTTEIYLIAPGDADVGTLQSALSAALSSNPVAALLVPRGERSERDYKELVKAIRPAAQGAGAAVLIEGEPGLVRLVGADGLHVTGGIGAVSAAIEALKPDFIVGAGDVRSRDDAMRKGEAGVDYILFGPLSGPLAPAHRDLAQWWSETMEVPGVLSDPEATAETFDAGSCEFIGLTLAVPEVAK
jgi:thiamine-phosphate pyrophosphorylase